MKMETIRLYLKEYFEPTNEDKNIKFIELLKNKIKRNWLFLKSINNPNFIVIRTDKEISVSSNIEISKIDYEKYLLNKNINENSSNL